MTDGCTCDDPDLVPTIDRNMAFPYISGNPYSRFCRTCERRQFCAKDFWLNAATRFIIPSGEDTPVPDEEYDDENYFECPDCGHPQFGHPDECEECGQEYHWEE